MTFRLSECDVIGFDLDMTLCRYKTSAMLQLCYDSLASFLVEQKHYPSSILEPFNQRERQMLSKHLIVDLTAFNVKFINGEGKIVAQLESISKGVQVCDEEWSHASAFSKFGQAARGQFLSMDSVFESGLSVMMVRLNQLKTDKELEKSNEQVVADIFAGFEFNYQPHAFQTDSGRYFPSMKAEPAKYIEPLSPKAIEWLREMKKDKKVFLMTSSNADYAKFILGHIFGDVDYWQFFDLCIGDARKPYFFNMESAFYSNKNDYPDVPVKELQSGRWYSQGNVIDLERYFKRELHNHRFTVAYFGDSLKSDIISADKTAGWRCVYLVEELYRDSQLVHGDDRTLLDCREFWTVDYFSESLHMKLARQHAALIAPSINEIANLPLDHPFEEKLVC